MKRLFNQNIKKNPSSWKGRIALLLTLFLFALLPTHAQFQMGAKKPMEKLRNAEQAIYHLYVDTVNEPKMIEAAIRGMLKELDPHSTYSTPKEVKAMTESLTGNFEGVGIQFNMLDDTLMVIQTVINGPSEKAGIIAGDRVVSVNDTAIAGVKMTREDIMKRLRGKKGTKVRLGIIRQGIKERLEFVVTRDKIPLKTIDAVYMIRPHVGYIRISSFGATTYKEFMEGISKLQEKGMNTLIIDLQENGGGYLQSAVEITNEFLQRGDMIVYTEGRRVSKQEYHARGGGKLLTEKVILLINEYSASAAEILTGALQDQDRGTVVGRRSFGKGLVQRPIEFDDGSMIRLTIAHYYTPTGRCIQKPYKKGDLKDYEMDIEKRYKHGELTNPDSIHFADSLKFYTLREHRTVYGGGGIMPDYFVPLDTTKYTRFHRQLTAKNIVLNSSLKFIDKNRKELKKRYPVFDDFIAKYEVPQSQIDGIIDEAKKQKITPKDEEELQRTIPYLKNQLKALVARDLWDMNEYFQIINETNDIVQKALDLLDN